MDNIDPQIIARQLIDYLFTAGGSLLLAILYLVIGWMTAGWLARLTRNYIGKTPRIDDTLAGVASRLVRILILIVTLVVVLDKVGVKTTSLVALLGAASLTVGLALQGALSNVASGVILLMLRPFKIGDFIDFGGTGGIVDEVGLFVTLMHTPDNVAMTVPNSKIWGNIIKNFATNDTRRCDMVFGIGYGDDMNKALQILKRLVEDEARFLKDPAPLVAVGELGESSVDIYVRPWVKRTDFFTAKLDFTKKVKEAFDADGITIPFPQRDVHLFQAGA